MLGAVYSNAGPTSNTRPPFVMNWDDYGNAIQQEFTVDPGAVNANWFVLEVTRQDGAVTP